PDESRWPAAVTHSPTARRAVLDVTMRMIRAELGTTTVTGAPVSGCTVSVVPLTLATLPRTSPRFAGGPPGLAPGDGLPRPARGLKLGFGLAPATPPAGWLQLPFMFSSTWSATAVTAPLASRSPVAVTHTPATASAIVPVPLCSTTVLVSYATVTSPDCSFTVILPL